MSDSNRTVHGAKVDLKSHDCHVKGALTRAGHLGQFLGVIVKCHQFMDFLVLFFAFTLFEL